MNEDIAFSLGLIIQRIAVKLDDKNYKKVEEDLNILNQKVLKISEVQNELEEQIRTNARNSPCRMQ
jgi:hypothetical protein